MFVTGEGGRKLTKKNEFGKTPFFNKGRVETLKPIIDRVTANKGVNTGGDLRVEREWFSRVLAVSTDYVPNSINPWIMPGVYEDPVGSAEAEARIHNDAMSAVSLALRWLVRGEDSARLGAIRILNEWADITTIAGESPLNWCDKWPMFLQAAMMMRGAPGYTTELDNRLKTTTLNGLKLSVAYNQINNWAAWGVCLEIASAVFLGRRDRFKVAVRRWRTVFDGAVVNNIPIHEIYRQGAVQGDGRTGLWYSNFLLSGLTIAAEWARFGGVWLYDYENPHSSFKGFYETVRGWTRFPASYPYNTSGTPSETVRTMAHDYILHALWPHAESQWLIDNMTNLSSRDNFGMTQYVLAYYQRPLYG